MLMIRKTSQFKKDYKRESRGRYGQILDELLSNVITSLISDAPLPFHYRDHALSGNWANYRDCHLKPDLVLIYKIDTDALVLVRLGSHSELFM